MNYSDYSKNMKKSSNLSQCQIDAYNYANKQNVLYDQDSNQILYGRSNLLKASGVSDGTCNLISPMMLRSSAKCGVGAGGGNPCYPDTIPTISSINSNSTNTIDPNDYTSPIGSNLITWKKNINLPSSVDSNSQGIFENFEGLVNNSYCQINNFVGLIFFILIILLFVSITYYEE